MVNTKKILVLQEEYALGFKKNAVFIILIIFSIGICNLAYCSTMMGGPGNDSYYIDRPNNLLIEYLNEGIDTVHTSVSHNLEPNFENIILQGTANINATGNDLDNVITGNSGDNVLEGKQGNDIYVYSLGGGQDSIIDCSGADTIKFGNGITLENIYFVKTFSDLKIYFRERSYNSITVKNFFAGNNKIEKFTFSDGRIINNIESKLINNMF